MSQTREIFRILKSRPTMEGAGVRLKRVFGQAHEKLDPFLLLDHFGSDNPDDYLAGFPYHPHRGIETITYMLEGIVKHEDSLGNAGVIESGEVQWMTAGSGIIHQEMPQGIEGTMMGFQLWANLPASHKMMDPRYREITKEDIPIVKYNENIEIKIVAGEVNGVKGPVEDIITEPEYLDIKINPHAKFIYQIENGHNAFAYVFEGQAYFDKDNELEVGKEHLVIFEDGDQIEITTQDSSVRFLLVSGKPIKEPVAWAGPIVMNSDEEIRLAFKEYREGNFIKHG